MAIPITDVIPRGKKQLIRVLTDAGYTTLEKCAAAGPGELIKLKGVGVKTIIAIKEHCFQNDFENWADPNQDTLMEEMTVHFMGRYGLSMMQANMVAKAFYWDNAQPSSLSRLLF